MSEAIVHVPRVCKYPGRLVRHSIHENNPANHQRVMDLAKDNCTIAEIATLMRMSANTLKEYYADDIETGRAVRRAGLRKRQTKVAMGEAEDKNLGPSKDMLIFLGKNELGQSDKVESQSTNVSYQIISHIGRPVRAPAEESK